MPKRTRDEVVQHLRDLQNLQPGAPYPAWFSNRGFTNWGQPISELAGEAADYLEDEFVYQGEKELGLF